jgi:hypothetical protein
MPTWAEMTPPEREAYLAKIQIAHEESARLRGIMGDDWADGVYGDD